MRAVYDLVPLQPLIIAARQIPYADQTLESIFPSRNVEQVDYKLVRENLLEQVVPARALDTPAPLIARPNAVEIRGGVPAFSAMDLLTETDLVRARRLAGIQIDLQPTVAATAARTTRTILNSIEFMRGQILSTGKVTLNANGVNQVADFGVPSANKVTAGTVWTNIAAPAATDLDTWRSVYVAANGGPPGRMLTSTRAQRLLLRNTSVINQAIGALMQRTQLSLAELSGYLAAEGLPNLETYDRQFGSFDAVTGAGNFTRYVPENILVMLPGTPLGETQLGITEEAVELVQAQILDAAQAPGITVITMVNENPVQKAVLSAAMGMPVLYQPFQILIATLW